MMSDDRADTGAECPRCGLQVSGAYCANCGTQTSGSTGVFEQPDVPEQPTIASPAVTPSGRTRADTPAIPGPAEPDPMVPGPGSEATSNLSTGPDSAIQAGAASQRNRSLFVALGALLLALLVGLAIFALTRSGQDEVEGVAKTTTTVRRSSTTSVDNHRTGPSRPEKSTTTSTNRAASTPTSSVVAPTIRRPPPSTTPRTSYVDAPARSGEWDGSACTPGDGPIPDGWWFGYSNGDITGTGGETLGFQFDLACIKVHPGANIKSDISNENPQTRSVYFVGTSDSTAGRCLEYPSGDMDGYGVGKRRCTGADVLGPSGWGEFWIRVQNGSVAEMVEQFSGS